ncbi:General amidase [Mycena indigotica]|uniref:General amidase n=1 Tax=Mycena indigotica TaxID=2126181 RepID=A0A8H6SHS5_9AGAR|nr:General amidase [Mycena indigotica]KAF7298916.1 General amidase [Mycena indigotica]
MESDSSEQVWIDFKTAQQLPLSAMPPPPSSLTTSLLPHNWQEKCDHRKQAQLDSIPSEWILKPLPKEQLNVMAIPRQCGLLSQLELEITETVDIATLLENLRLGLWSSVQVTTAFYKRAVIAQQLTNCLTEIFVERALARAKEVDDHLARTGTVLGPLHGLPISLKDQFSMEGLETIMGYAKWIGRVATSDCVLVQLLYECGAVPFVRTNVPQTLMHGETHNHVFGRTLNPYNTSFTPGGSSGGEGALLAMKGSPLGVGTDISGSLRIPSAFCGLYTLRPSYARLPYYGAVNALEGQESINSVLGPMANSMSGVKIFTKAILGTEPWRRDPLVLRKPWSESEYQLEYHGGGGRLCFAIMWDNGVVKPHPPLHRAMRTVKRALEAAGHQVIDWENHRHLEIYKNAETIFAADGGHDYLAECEGAEPLIQTMQLSEHVTDLEVPKSSIPILEEPLVKKLVGRPHHRSAWEASLDFGNYTKKNANLGNPTWITGKQPLCGQQLDDLSMQLFALPSHIQRFRMALTRIDSFYTTLCSALDLTCSVFPVNSVDPTLDDIQPPHEFYNHEDEHIYGIYEADKFPGCPVGLQLIGRVQEEEAVIRMTEIVAEILKASFMGMSDS